MVAAASAASDACQTHYLLFPEKPHRIVLVIDQAGGDARSSPPPWEFAFPPRSSMSTPRATRESPPSSKRKKMKAAGGEAVPAARTEAAVEAAAIPTTGRQPPPRACSVNASATSLLIFRRADAILPLMPVEAMSTPSWYPQE